MNWIVWAVLGVIVILALLLLSAAIDAEKYRRELWDEFWHPPDSEVKSDEQDP